MRLLGLTGDIGCGKSTVAGMLADRGAAVLDSDLLVRELYSDLDFATQLAKHFSPQILAADGSVDRGKLGQVVFSDPSARVELEHLVHPAVAKLREHKLKVLERTGKYRVAVVEAVKLLESGQGKECDEIWCIVCNPQSQKVRLMRNRGLTADEADSRMHAQPSRNEKAMLAGPVPLRWISNDGTKAELASQVDLLWRHFTANNP